MENKLKCVLYIVQYFTVLATLTNVDDYVSVVSEIMSDDTFNDCIQTFEGIECGRGFHYVLIDKDNNITVCINADEISASGTMEHIYNNITTISEFEQLFD